MRRLELKKKFQWDITYLQWGITAFGVVFCGLVVYFVFDRWTSASSFVEKVANAFSPVIYGLMFAYLLGKIKKFLEISFIFPAVNRVFKKASVVKKRNVARSISIVVTITITFFFVIGGALLVLHQLVTSLQLLVDTMPDNLAMISKWLIEHLDENTIFADTAIIVAENIIGRFVHWIDVALLSPAESIAASIIDGAVTLMRLATNIAVGFVISLYMMYNNERFAAQFKKIAYGLFDTDPANRIIRNFTRLDEKFGSFITARLIDAVVIGVLCYIFNIIARMPYPMLIAVIIGITNIIPFFGPYIGGVPSAALILLIDPIKSIVFGLFIVVIQMLDGNVIYPKIQGNSFGLSGVWIVSSLMVGGGLFGFVGILLSVPVVAFVYTVFKEMVANRLRERGLPVDTEDYLIYKTKDDSRYDSHLY